MRLVPVSHVVDGALIARDVMIGRTDGMPLLRAGVRMNDTYRKGLNRAGVHAVYIEDDVSVGIVPEPLVSSDVRSFATRQLAVAFDKMKDLFAAGETMSATLTEELGGSLAQIVERIIREIEQSGETALALEDLSCNDAYTFNHSIDVTALGLLLGRRQFAENGWIDYAGVRQHDRIDERLISLGLGLLLHDIGKLAIPSQILDKPGKLNPDEWSIVRSHPRTGAELLRNATAWSPLVRAVVLRHHERFDGSGYPDGRAGEDIHEMARIAAVADVYDAITSSRTHAPARPAHAGVRVIVEGSGTLFDPQVVALFSKVVAPYPPGVEIELADGRRGIVVSVPRRALDRPLVRVIEGPGAPYEVALEADPSIRIAGWDLTHTAVSNALAIAVT
jgi:HD-GYP domain-containing protein (c-di-GMP phosphodiesterase class II)